MNEEQRIRREKLRWHCRRALLELDIVFQRFWAHTGDDLDEATAATLERLLEMQDHDMWELVSGRSATDDPQIKELVESLRALRATPGRC
jgi:succinate dehydrogenase flavin-adding protein (antitoxin of CptAB toxin-antitoxin module)